MNKYDNNIYKQRKKSSWFVITFTLPFTGIFNIKSDDPVQTLRQIFVIIPVVITMIYNYLLLSRLLSIQ